MNESIRIGTRDSKLAEWQARRVQDMLEQLGFQPQLVFIKSEGDTDQLTPLAEMGGKGVFTKALDDALLNNEIDLAVHSYKDLPTEYPLPIKVAAILKRGDARDVLVTRSDDDFLLDSGYKAVIATGSNRRKAQWLHQYPGHEITDLRGNVQTRLEKLHENEWDGAIFAAAGLIRLNLEDKITRFLDWMVPAPAQGAIAVVIRDEDKGLENKLNKLNHSETERCTGIERQLLNRLEAGCSAPVGAIVTLDDDIFSLYAVALSLDGSLRYEVRLTEVEDEADDLGLRAAEMLLEQGADTFMNQL